MLQFLFPKCESVDNYWLGTKSHQWCVESYGMDINSWEWEEDRLRKFSTRKVYGGLKMRII